MNASQTKVVLRFASKELEGKNLSFQKIRATTIRNRCSPVLKMFIYLGSESPRRLCDSCKQKHQKSFYAFAHCIATKIQRLDKVFSKRSEFNERVDVAEDFGHIRGK